MDQVEQKFIRTENKIFFIQLRHVDDVFFSLTHGEQELEKFLNYLNNFTPNLSFTHKPSKTSIPFLDHKVILTDAQLETYFYMKNTDHYQYPYYVSSHPEQTKRSAVYSETLQVNKLCEGRTVTTMI